jgi:predicted kinase
MPAIMIRSDKERKRLFAHQHDTENALNEGIYSQQISDKTYQHLLNLTSQIIQAGFSVIVDATFLKAKQRRPFQNLAAELDVEFHIVQLSASMQTLQQRLLQRSTEPDNISDATLEVIQHQRSQAEPPSDDEPSIRIDTEQMVDYPGLLRQLR